MLQGSLTPARQSDRPTAASVYGSTLQPGLPASRNVTRLTKVRYIVLLSLTAVAREVLATTIEPGDVFLTGFMSLTTPIAIVYS